MNDIQKQEWIRSAKQKLAKQETLINRYARQVIDLEIEVRMLKRIIEEQKNNPSRSIEASARIDEMDCDVYNL